MNPMEVPATGCAHDETGRPGRFWEARHERYDSIRQEKSGAHSIRMQRTGRIEESNTKGRRVGGRKVWTRAKGSINRSNSDRRKVVTKQQRRVFWTSDCEKNLSPGDGRSH